MIHLHSNFHKTHLNASLALANVQKAKYKFYIPQDMTLIKTAYSLKALH
jgi:hypothetical protein